MTKVDKVVHKYLVQAVNKNDVAHINDGALLREDLAIDSLRMISLFSNAISDLDISITSFEDTELMSISSVSDLKGLFLSKLK
jgi:acyl carrier protein